MDVNKLILSRLFDSTERLEAPLFQRPYVWERKQNWEPLWEAIELHADQRLAGNQARPHFLGTIVLDQLRTPPGRVHARQIVDGQQRLTTLQLALAAARDICRENGMASHEQAFRKLTDNSMPLSTCQEDVFKVWPTNADRGDFEAVMTAGSVEVVRRLPHANPDDQWLIPDAYLYFHEIFTEWLRDPRQDNFAARLDSLYYTFLEGLQVVVINLEEKDDAQEIFETLNALGTPLLPADLVKNFLFRKALEQGHDTDALYERYWRPFDTERAFWREKTRQGRLKRPRIDLYLYHYVTYMLGEVVLDTQLFDSFKSFLRASSDQSASRHMGLFRAYAEVYQGFEKYPRNSREELFFYRLREMDIGTLHPLMLEICRRYADPEHQRERRQAMEILESFLVRRVVCEQTPKGYNRFFTEIIRKARQVDDFSPEFLTSTLLAETAEASSWPTDEVFREAWLDLAFYRRIRKSKTRMILEAIERKMHDDKAENVEFDRSLTLEHLMPREWAAHWPLPCAPGDEVAVAQATKQRRDMLDRVGNLTLVSKRLNPSLSNGPWCEKREAILEHSALNLNRPFSTTLKWTEDTIRTRSQALFEIAKRIWPRPSA